MKIPQFLFLHYSIVSDISKLKGFFCLNMNFCTRETMRIIYQKSLFHLNHFQFCSLVSFFRTSLENEVVRELLKEMFEGKGKQIPDI